MDLNQGKKRVIYWSTVVSETSFSSLHELQELNVVEHNLVQTINAS
jgi:hypothetical protein